MDQQSQKAAAYGYQNDYSSPLKLISLETSSDTFPEPSSRPKTLITWNVWMHPSINYSMATERTSYVITILKESHADIIFLQEVGFDFYQALKQDPFFDMYHFTPVEAIQDPARDVINLTLVKALGTIKSVYGIIKGEHLYPFTITETDTNLLINFNLHAGSKFSPGIVNAGKYQTYREEQMKMIRNLCIPSKPVIVAGDFNFHLDYQQDDPFPEKETLRHLYIEQFHLKDSWRAFTDDPGLTEDTDVNDMRWNVKQIRKAFRYDGIFVPESCVIKEVSLLGRQPVFQTSMEDSRLTQHINKAFLDRDQMRTTNGSMPWWPSDHFGVMVVLE